MEIVAIWTLRIEHDYYRNGIASDFDVQISPETHVLLRRRNMIWRKKNINEWCLYSFGDFKSDDIDVLVLELAAQGSELQYVTDFVWLDRKCYEVEIPVESSHILAKACMDRIGVTRNQSCIMKLFVPFGKIINSRMAPITTTLLFQAVRKYWEYICIPRKEQQKRNIKLEDIRKTVNFGEAEHLIFMEHNACKIRSMEKLSLQSFYENIDLALWEIFPSGDNKRLLLRNLPFPDPTLNLGRGPDTVWKILYF